MERHLKIENEGMEKYLSCKWTSKESQGSNTYIGQNRLQNKDCNKRQRKVLYNNKGDNPTRGYKNCKHTPNMGASKK